MGRGSSAGRERGPVGRTMSSSVVRPLGGAILAAPWETALPVVNSERERVFWGFFFLEGLVEAAWEREREGNSKESVFVFVWGWEGSDSIDSCSSESKAQAPGFDQTEETVAAMSLSLSFCLLLFSLSLAPFDLFSVLVLSAGGKASIYRSG